MTFSQEEDDEDGLYGNDVDEEEKEEEDGEGFAVSYREHSRNLTPEEEKVILDKL
jgi:hypothetical protein